MSTNPNEAGNVGGFGAPGPTGETGAENAPPSTSTSAPFTDPSTTGADPVTGRRDVETNVDPAFGAHEADTPAADRPASEVADENSRLRSELDEENARLREAVAQSRAANVDAEGLTDEDVRRIEHPAEFVD